jgi:LCP family protein required for cell wall assembly
VTICDVKPRLWLLLGLAGGLSIACLASLGIDPQEALQTAVLETSVVETATALALPTLTPSATPTITSTPTPEDTPTPSLTPTPTPVWYPFQGPTDVSSTEIPPPMPLIAFTQDVLNVIVLGSDERPGVGGYRTDTMMVVSVDPQRGTVKLISFPRDLYVFIPGWRMDRINTADVRGGYEMTRQTILYNFGIELDGWARTGFSGFINAVDALGGITVQSTGYLTDECGGVVRSYGPGSYTMDGFEALCYTRVRLSGGDFDRLRRQQEVLRAIFFKVVSLDGLARLPEVYSQFYNSLRTDLELGELLPLVPTAVQVAADPSRIQQFAVDRTMADFWRTPGGASVLLPKREAVLAMLMQAFGPEAFAVQP